MRFTTSETPCIDGVSVEKRDGRSVGYRRERYFASIYEALSSKKGADRGESATLAANVVSRIETRVSLMGVDRITSADLADMAIDELERVDASACYRYASFSPHRGRRFGI